MSVKTFFDTGVLVGALLLEHPEHDACENALETSPDRFTNAHCLAEVFATLTGFYKVPNGSASEMTLSLLATLPVEPLTMEDYRTAIAEARQRGVMGGGIYDSLHATVARRFGAKRIATRNPGHFAHAAPEVEILTP